MPMTQMSWRAVLAVAACLVGVAPAAGQRDADKQLSDTDTDRTTRPQPDLTDGFWPSVRLQENVIRRIAMQVQQQYDLTDEQYEKFERMSLERWPSFLKAHRAELQPLINEWIENRLAPEPLPPEQIMDWADRMMPVWRKIRKEVNAGKAEFGEILDSEQRKLLNGQFMAFSAGLGRFELQLKRWQNGEDLDKAWESPGRRGWRERRRNLAASMDVWDRYVKRFIERHDLDEAQRTSAASMLKELKQRAARHIENNQAKWDGLLAKLDETKDADAKREIRKQQDEIRRPVRDMFAELRRRLDALLTAAQRTATRPAADDTKQATTDASEGTGSSENPPPPPRTVGTERR